MYGLKVRKEELVNKIRTKNPKNIQEIKIEKAISVPD
uniref:Uncharacterized protein n=1 Tax=Rhizophora mucronata TaxID=61149 RepID=A0A2P2NDA5_RHIMU